MRDGKREKETDRVQNSNISREKEGHAGEGGGAEVTEH